MTARGLGLLLGTLLLLSACGRYGPPRRIPVVPDEPAAITKTGETGDAAATQIDAKDEESSK